MPCKKGAVTSWLPCFLICLEGYRGRSGSRLMKRKKNFPLLILVGVSLIACGLYYATYFQAVATSWKTTHWFGFRGDKSLSKKPEQMQENRRGLHLRNRHLVILPSYYSGEGTRGNDDESDDDSVGTELVSPYISSRCIPLFTFSSRMIFRSLTRRYIIPHDTQASHKLFRKLCR